MYQAFGFPVQILDNFFGFFKGFNTKRKKFQNGLKSAFLKQFIGLQLF